MSWATVASVAGSVIMSSMNKGAAGEAGAAQAEATAMATAEQRRQYNQTREDQAPWRDTGSAAIRALAVKLGLAPHALGGVPQTLEQFAGVRPTRPQFTSIGSPGTSFSYGGEGGMDIYGTPATPGGFDEAGYTAAMTDYEKRVGEFDARGAAAPDSDFGELNKKFSINDFWNDPVVQLGYQSGLDLGTKALKNAAPLTTGMDSGAALKELLKFGTDYSGMKAGDSRGRFVDDQNTTYNRLAGVSGMGQVSANTTANAGMNMANNVSGLMSAQGNATAAGRIAQGNAMSGGIGNLSNWWQQQNTLDRLAPRSSGVATNLSTWSPSGQWWGATGDNF